MALDRPATVGLARKLFGQDPARTLALLRAAWPLAVGPELARRTEVLALDGKVLRVRVPDAGWTKVLHRMRRDIVKRLRDVAGELTPDRLGFTEGGIPPLPALPSAAGPGVAAEPPLADAIETQAALIPDPEIRERFRGTARRYLGRSSSSSSS